MLTYRVFGPLLLCADLSATVIHTTDRADVVCGVWVLTVYAGLFVLMLGVNPINKPYFFLVGSSVHFSHMLISPMSVGCVADGIDHYQTSGAGLLARIYPCE